MSGAGEPPGAAGAAVEPPAGSRAPGDGAREAAGAQTAAGSSGRPGAGLSPEARRLAAFVTALPKAELHVHLEGAMPRRTLLALAARRGVTLPADDEAGLDRWFRFESFPHFVEIYLTCSACLAEPADFYRLATDVLAEQARQGVAWTEAHFTISTHLARGLPGDELAAALAEAAEAARRRHGVELRLVPDIVRNLPVEAAEATVEWAIAARERGLAVALGIAGIERGYPDEPFVPCFEAAAAAGLHRVAHAGEHEGPERVRSVLELLGAERIGHGVRSVEDPGLVARLAAERVPLEVCPSSNVRLGVFPDLAAHSFDALYRSGVPVSVGSDDPPLFATTLVEEYVRLAETFGYSPGELAGLAAASFAHSFLPSGERRRRTAEVGERAAAAGEEILGRPVVPVDFRGRPPEVGTGTGNAVS